jgi:phage terminase large subunit
VSEFAVDMPEVIADLFARPARYRCAYGGRGSGKSYNFAKMLAIRGMAAREKILCARELQNSIKDSSMSEVKRAIESEPWLAAHYEMGETFIRGRNGTEFLFRGLRLNPKEIKSTAGVTICWVEEAEAVSEASWRNLIPTIRAPGSEIWVTWNPESIDAPVQKRFILNPAPDCVAALVNYRDNPWFPPELEAERVYCAEHEPDLYPHIWEGECLTRSDAQILHGKWAVAEFTPDPDTWGGPYYGLDFGFANDPTAGVKAWISPKRELCIEHELYQVHLELDHTAAKMMEFMPGCEKNIVWCDNARPESISYLRRHGIPRADSVAKWAGSVEDGIAHLRSYSKILIHPRCLNMAKEARLYSYKVDRYTEQVLDTVLDAHNHLIDACRYSLNPLITRKDVAFFTGLNVRPTS